jgi:hypothetical protein
LYRCKGRRRGYRRVHGELTALGIKVEPSTIWEILKREGIDPAPQWASITWADFLRSQADALLACDFIETITLNGQRQYILAIIEHVTRRVRVLGTTAHPRANWVIQAIKNLVMDLEMRAVGRAFCSEIGMGVPGAHGRGPRRGRRQDGAHRYSDAGDELDHGAVGVSSRGS